MSSERIFLDTAFVIALLNRNDEYHERAKDLAPRLYSALEVWTTEAILVEIGNSLGAVAHRQTAYQFIQGCYDASANIRVVPVSSDLLKRALQLYQARQDKTWGLTDCISFVVMEEEGLVDAMTTDSDFQEAGFRSLMRTN